MKRLVYADGKVIGDYPDDWEPPPECDMAEGLAAGKMAYIASPAEPLKMPPLTLVDQILADPKEVEKLKAALK